MEEEQNQTSWNLSLYKTQIIGGLLNEGVSAYLKGNLKHWFFTWQSIAITISNRLSSIEKIKIKKMEKAICETQTKPKYAELVRDYAEYINEILRKLGLDIEEKGARGSIAD